METLHIRKESFEGYHVGVGVEYPGIIVSAKSDKALKDEFLKALPGHKHALEKHGIKSDAISVMKISCV